MSGFLSALLHENCASQTPHVGKGVCLQNITLSGADLIKGAIFYCCKNSEEPRKEWMWFGVWL